MSNSNSNSNHSSSSNSRKQNGIDSGLTLNAAALDKPSSKKPYPYANVGVKSKQNGGKGNNTEDEVRC